MFQDTPYTSPEWLLAIYIPPISVARLPFLHGRSCISGLDTFFRMALLPAGKRDFFGALVCLSRLLGWPKRAYAFFPGYIQEKTHTPFLAKGIIVHVLPLFMCFQDDSNLLPEIFFLQFCLAFKVSSLPSLNIFLKERYHLKLCRFVNCRPLSSIFQLAFLGAGRKSAGLLQALFWFWGAG